MKARGVGMTSVENGFKLTHYGVQRPWVLIPAACYTSRASEASFTMYSKGGTMRIAGTAVQVALILFVSGTVIHATAQSAKSKDQAAQESYCHATGGMIEVRHAVFGTNDDRRNWLWL